MSFPPNRGYPNDGKKLIFTQKSFCELISKVVRTSSRLIIPHNRLHLSVCVVHRIRPHQVAEQTGSWNLSKSIQFLNIVQLSFKVQIHFLFIGRFRHERTEICYWQVLRGVGYRIGPWKRHIWFGHIFKCLRWRLNVHYFLKLKKEVSCLHSWFPRSIKTVLGNDILRDKTSIMT